MCTLLIRQSLEGLPFHLKLYHCFVCSTLWSVDCTLIATFCSYNYYMWSVQIEGKKHDDSPAYLKLPSTRQQLEERGLPTGNKSVLQEGPYSLTPNSKDVLYIQSFVCSTKLTHNGMYVTLNFCCICTTLPNEHAGKQISSFSGSKY